jgi:hypothetical protein
VAEVWPKIQGPLTSSKHSKTQHLRALDTQNFMNVLHNREGTQVSRAGGTGVAVAPTFMSQAAMESG